MKSHRKLEFARVRGGDGACGDKNNGWYNSSGMLDLVVVSE